MIETFIIDRVKHYLANSDILRKMINDTNSMTNMGVPLIAEQASDLRKRLAENKKVIEGFSNFVRQAALTNPSQIDSVIRTNTAERDKAETECLILERELANKEHQLRELKSEHQDKGMREHLEELLENFDSQDDLKNEILSNSSFRKLSFTGITNWKFGYAGILRGNPQKVFQLVELRRILDMTGPPTNRRLAWIEKKAQIYQVLRNRKAILLFHLGCHTSRKAVRLNYKWRATRRSDEPFPRRSLKNHISLR